MGCTTSKLKGDHTDDLISSYPSNSQPPASPPTEKTTRTRLPTGTKAETETETETRIPDTKTFESTFASAMTPSHERPPNEKARKQSLRLLWKERKGVHEPKDENGRGLYSRLTTEELVKMGGAQPVDGRVRAGGAM